jgi:hypothetical protein
MTMIPIAKTWAETTYCDPIPDSLIVRVNRRTIGQRLAKCRYLLRRSGGIFHEPGGKVIARQSIPLIEDLIRDGVLVDDGPAGLDLPDARMFKLSRPTWP